MGFFRATHRTTGEVVSFGLEDIQAGSYCDEGVIYVHDRSSESSTSYLEYWLKDYDLQYQHAGEWHDYKLGGDE